MIGFGVRHTNSRESRHDDNLVEFVPVLDIKTNMTHHKHIPLQYHKCTPSDLKKFENPHPSQVELIHNDLKENFFYCLNETDVFGKKQ